MFLTVGRYKRCHYTRALVACPQEAAVADHDDDGAAAHLVAAAAAALRAPAHTLYPQRPDRQVASVLAWRAAVAAPQDRRRAQVSAADRLALLSRCRRACSRAGARGAHAGSVRGGRDDGWRPDRLPVAGAAAGRRRALHCGAGRHRALRPYQRHAGPPRLLASGSPLL